MSVSSNELEEKLKEDFVKRCKEKLGEKLKCVLLYGSRARGTAEPDSDWDFLLWRKNYPIEE